MTIVITWSSMALNIVVCVKETYDVDHIKVDSATLDPILQGIPVEIEEMSKNALEAAIQLKEKHGGKVIAVSVAGSKTIKKSLKEALAMGADEALIINHDFEEFNPAATALALSHGIKSVDGVNIVMMGEGSADNYSGQVGPRVAHLLDMPVASYVCGIEMESEKLKCTRDLEDCFEIDELPLPSVVTVTNEINEPRLPSLTQILKASKKPVKEIGLELPKDALDSAIGSTRTIKNKAPRQDRKRIKLEGALDETIPELIAALSKEGFVGR
jgi:electron transfer flavoprotein beta subunit